MSQEAEKPKLSPREETVNHYSHLWFNALSHLAAKYQITANSYPELASSLQASTLDTLTRPHVLFVSSPHNNGASKARIIAKSQGGYVTLMGYSTRPALLQMDKYEYYPALDSDIETWTSNTDWLTKHHQHDGDYWTAYNLQAIKILALEAAESTQVLCLHTGLKTSTQIYSWLTANTRQLNLQAKMLYLLPPDLSTLYTRCADKAWAIYSETGADISTTLAYQLNRGFEGYKEFSKLPELPFLVNYVVYDSDQTLLNVFSALRTGRQISEPKKSKSLGHIRDRLNN